MRKSLPALLLGAALLGGPASAQFVGPAAGGPAMTVADAAAARAGVYLTLEGAIASHLREDYYLFRDSTGEIRVEIEPEVFAGRRVTPETRLRLLGEVDRNSAGLTYVWVKSMTVLD